jgi:hypothetical protein
MRSNRRRYWLIKRFALGLAIAAFAAPVAQARIDEGSSVQANGYQSFVTDFPSSQVNASDVNRGDQIEIVRSQPRSTGDSFVASDYGMPRAMPSDYALASGDQIEVVRALPRGTSSDKIEFVRTQPRSIGGPQVVAAGFDWSDAAIGAGLALGLVLLGWGAVVATRHLGRPQTA